MMSKIRTKNLLEINSRSYFEKYIKLRQCASFNKQFQWKILRCKNVTLEIIKFMTFYLYFTSCKVDLNK